MKSICFVTQSLGIGGVEKSLIELIKTLDALEFNVTVLCMNASSILKNTIEELCFADEIPGMKKPWQNIVDGIKKGHMFRASKKIIAAIQYKTEKNLYKRWNLLSYILPEYVGI